MGTRTLAALALVSALLLPAPLLAQEPEPEAFTPLFNGQNLDGWDTTSANMLAVSTSGGVLRLSGGPGWLLTPKNYYDFIVRFDARVVDSGTIGGVIVHAVLERLARASYEVTLSDSGGRAGTLLWHRDYFQTLLGLPDGPTVVASSEWRTYELENRNTTLTFTVGGQRLFVARGLRHNMGRVGFSVTKGAIEFRNIGVHTHSLPDQPPIAGSVKPGGEVSTPRPLSRVLPQYPSTAFSAGAQGEVWLDCVVLPDGSVGTVRVVRSFRSDIDEQAITAAKQWRFIPGTRNGEPAAVQVTISMSFTLK